MSKFLCVYLAGALSLMIFIIIITPANQKPRGLNSMIKECEEPLPRTQHCELIAVPSEEVE